MRHERVVTKYMSEINFKISARLGDILEFGFEVTDVGRTSLSMRCDVRNKNTQVSIITIDRIVFVAVNDQGIPVPHDFSAVLSKVG